MKHTLLAIASILSACATAGPARDTTCEASRFALILAEENLDAAKKLCEQRSPCDYIPHAENALTLARATYEAECPGAVD